MSAAKQIVEDVAPLDLLVNVAETDTRVMDEVLGLICADEPDGRVRMRVALLRIAAAETELRRRETKEIDR